MDPESKLTLIEKIMGDENLTLAEAWSAIASVIDGGDPYEQDSETES